MPKVTEISGIAEPSILDHYPMPSSIYMVHKMLYSTLLSSNFRWLFNINSMWAYHNLINHSSTGSDYLCIVFRIGWLIQYKKIKTDKCRICLSTSKFILKYIIQLTLLLRQITGHILQPNVQQQQRQPQSSQRTLTGRFFLRQLLTLLMLALNSSGAT